MGLSICKVGIAGYGDMGKMYYKILKNLRLDIGVADPFSEEENFLKDYKELKNYDIIIIALPTEMHKEAIKFFSDKQRALLVEKPLCLTYKESKETFEEIENSQLRVMCGLTGLYHPEFKKMYEQIKNIGKIKRIKEKLHEASPNLKKYLNTKKGVLTINGIHTIHRFYKIAKILNPAERLSIEKVIISNKHFKSEGEDSATGVLKLGSIPFEFDISYRNCDKCDNGYPIEYETKIEGEKGVIHVIGWESCELETGGRILTLYRHPDGPLSGQSQYSRVELGLKEQIKEFFSFVQSNEKIHPTVKECIDAQKLLEECYQKADRKREMN